MGNIVSYLKWRGDISLLERPFCEVDNLLLSELSYMNFTGIVPSPTDGGSVLIADITEAIEKQAMPTVLVAPPEDFITAFAKSRRFCTARLSNYIDVTDPVSQMQFAALHIILEDGTTYISFRGTDSTIVGWREDFSMSYQIMPSQSRAQQYLCQTMTDPEMKYRIGGHSKGGNLAVYAALCCPQDKQSQIIGVYSNDGPGLCPEIIDMAAYQKIRHKIVRIIPDFSLIGKLFEQDEADLIVKSSVSGAGAHEGFTWEVEGDQFVLCKDVSEESRFYNDIFDTWIESSSKEQRAAFTKDFFDALEAGGAKEIPEITANGMDGIESILIGLIRSEPKTKIVMGKFIRSLLVRLKNIDWKKALKQKEVLTGILLFFIGLFLVAMPSLASKCISILLGVSGLFLLGKRILSCSIQTDSDIGRKKLKIVIYLVLICIIMVLLNHISILMGFTELILSIGFFGLTYYEVRTAFYKKPAKAKWEKIFRTLMALLAVMFGVLPVTTMALEISLYTLTAGSFVLIFGIAAIFKAIYKESKKV